MASVRNSTTALSCKGRQCPKCRKCCDWEFPENNETRKWLGKYHTWSDGDRERWHFEVHKQFKKRDDATCIRDDIYKLDLLGAYVNINPRCDRASLHSATASLEDSIRNGIDHQYSEGGRDIAPDCDGVKCHFAVRPHSCLCDPE